MQRELIQRAAIIPLILLMGNTLASPAEPELYTPLPSSFSYTTTAAESNDSFQWWKRMDDPMLDSLIEKVRDNNYNLAIAAKRIEVARQGINQAKAGYYPTIGISAGWNRSRTSGFETSIPDKAMTNSAFSLGANMSWEVDLFGKITASVKESKANWKATKAEYDALMVSLYAEMATQYCNLRTYQAELKVAQQHIKSQGEVLKIVEARHEAGLASKLDVAQARTIYYSTQAMLPEINANIDVTINAIALLLGIYPTEVESKLKTPAPIPQYHQLIDPGTPLELLHHRPDIAEAEQQIAARAAAWGVAKKDYLPTLSIQGSLGTLSHSAKNLFKNESLTYSIEPTLSWTLFDGLGRKAASAAAREEMAIAIDQYNLAVVTAVQDVDNALALYNNTLLELDLIKSTLMEANEAFKLSLDLYKGGLSDFYNVADAQISMLEYADKLTTLKGTAAIRLINLYKALGGGWQ